MVPVKSSIGLISSKISSRPDCSGTSFAPACRAASIRFRQRSLPSNQSNESVCRARRSGTSRGSLKRAKETRRVAELVAEALREAANRGPSELVAELSPHARETPADTPRGGSRKPRTSECSANCSIAEGHAARQLYLTMRFTVAPQHCSFWAKRQVHAASSGDLGGVTNATVDSMCRASISWVKTSIWLWLLVRRHRAHPGQSGRASPVRPARPRSRCDRYLTVTVAPAPSRAALALSAASLLTRSRTGLGAPSTRSFASFRPRLVRLLTSLMT